VDRHLVGRDAGELAGVEAQNVALQDDLTTALKASGAEVAVDFSTPQAVKVNIRTMLDCGVSPGRGHHRFEAGRLR
jgi:dihydrodipicolinate reductase